MKPRTRLSKLLRRAHHLVFDASRDGRCSEVAWWSNGLASVGLGVGLFVQTRSWPFTICVPIIAFVLLRAALTHRMTLWISASFGTLAVAGAGGGLAWLFAHIVERPWAPSVAAVLGAGLAALVPAWAYSRLAHRRAHDVRDSLVDPVSVPSSRT